MMWHVPQARISIRAHTTHRISLGHHAGGGFFYEMRLTDSVEAAAAGHATPSGPIWDAVASGDGTPRLRPEVLPLLEGAARVITKAEHPFQRLQVTPEFAAHVFADNPYKLDMLRRIPAGEAVSLYRCGAFVDLCRGPHVPHTGLLKVLAFYRAAGSSGVQPAGVRGEGLPPPGSPTQLQRVYGQAFRSKDDAAAWQRAMEEAKKRDHRVIGRDQALFFFHDLSPGSAFLLPHGTRVYNKVPSRGTSARGRGGGAERLCIRRVAWTPPFQPSIPPQLLEVLRDEYRRRGYEEVITPQLYKPALWSTSGHLQNYAENMYGVSPGLLSATPEAAGDGCCGDHANQPAASTPTPVLASPTAAAAAAGEAASPELFGLKPMNCPGHCLMFAQVRRGCGTCDINRSNTHAPTPPPLLLPASSSVRHHTGTCRCGWPTFRRCTATRRRVLWVG